MLRTLNRLSILLKRCTIPVNANISGTLVRYSHLLIDVVENVPRHAVGGQEVTEPDRGEDGDVARALERESKQARARLCVTPSQAR